MSQLVRPLTKIVLAFAAAASLAGCSGGDEKPRTKAESLAASAAHTKKWAFVDAFAALKARDPARRLEAVEWIGAHLSSNSGLAKDALRAAATDDDPQVSARAKRYLSAMGERR